MTRRDAIYRTSAGLSLSTEVALPEVLRRGVAAGPEVADSAGDRAVVLGRHGPSSCSVREHARGRHSFSLGLPPACRPPRTRPRGRRAGGRFVQLALMDSQHCGLGPASPRAIAASRDHRPG